MYHNAKNPANTVATPGPASSGAFPVVLDTEEDAAGRPVVVVAVERVVGVSRLSGTEPIR